MQRVALVTGAGSGIGLAVAKKLAASGHFVFAADINGKNAAGCADGIVADGGCAAPLHIDVGNAASISQGFENIRRRHHRVDILVNNAGIPGERGPLEGLSLVEWQKTMRINLTSMFMTCQAALPAMLANRWGRIVNMSSLTARGQPGVNRASYCASKTGINGFSRTLAGEICGSGVTVNCVAPSRIRTGLTLATGAGSDEFFRQGAAATVVGRLGEPDDISSAVNWLCSDAASLVNGAVLDVNGGTRMT